jgi:hypothetical protein
MVSKTMDSMKLFFPSEQKRCWNMLKLKWIDPLDIYVLFIKKRSDLFAGWILGQVQGTWYNLVDKIRVSDTILLVWRKLHPWIDCRGYSP